MVLTKNACKEVECINPSRKRGWCESHYNLIWRRGRYQKKFDRCCNTDSIQKRLSLKSKLNEENGCIEWMNPHSLGYGYISINKKRKGAHIVSWELFHGKSADGFVIMHRCDNKRCINPQHLMLGDDVLNQKDKVLKGRQAKGTDFKDTKLNEDKIREIFVLHRKGLYQYQIAKKFNVHQSHISEILNRKIWKHVEISL